MINLRIITVELVYSIVMLTQLSSAQNENSGLEIHSSTNVQFLVVDPLGRKTGCDGETQTPLNQTTTAVSAYSGLVQTRWSTVTTSSKSTAFKVGVSGWTIRSYEFPNLSIKVFNRWEVRGRSFCIDSYTITTFLFPLRLIH